MIKNVLPVVLAAGEGKRLGGNKRKHMRLVSGKPVLQWGLDTLRRVGFDRAVVVLRFDDLETPERISLDNFNVKWINDPFCLGAGHSLYSGIAGLNRENVSIKNLLVFYADDFFLYRPETIANFIAVHRKVDLPLTIMTVEKEKISSIGGLKKDGEGHPVGFYTRSELINKKRKKVEIVCGSFLFRFDWLGNNLSKMDRGKTGEYLLTSLIKVAYEDGSPANVFSLKSSDEWWGINTKADLVKARNIKRSQLNHEGEN
jgi:bifunctional UDP-N-acetylglucosamine pyrophosphorylase/glucosamine-1-phosphate N-acetyltransferase